MQERVRAIPEEISGFTDKVMSHLEACGVEPRATHHVALVFDELLMNVGTHGDCRDVPADIRLTVLDDKVVGEVADAAPPFDPRESPVPRPATRVEDTPIGGLGLLLVHKFCSKLDYEYRNGRNVTRFEIARDLAKPLQ